MYPLIDLLRACAALMVAVFHVLVLDGWTGSSAGALWRTFFAGSVGVNLFLVISGFVITLSAYHGWTQSPTHFRWPFMKRRLARLMPLYVLTCAVFVLCVDRSLLAQDGLVQLTHYVAHALMLHNLHPDTHGSINGPSWSIGLEMQFYVLLILAIPWLARQRLTVVAGVLCGVTWLYRYAVTLWLPPDTAPILLQVVYTTQLPGTLDQFGCGIMLALVCVRGPASARAYLTPGGPNFHLWAGLAVLGLLPALVYFWPAHNPWALTPLLLGWRTSLSLGLVCTLVAAITFPRPGLAAFKPFLFLGQISYGIYLWHLPVLLILQRRFDLHGLPLMVAVLGLTLGLAALSWLWLEKPLIQWARRGL